MPTDPRYYRGDDWTITMSFATGEGRHEAPLDVTGYTLAWGLKRHPDDADDLVLLKQVSAIAPHAPQGIIAIEIPATETAALADGEYYWGAALFDPDNRRQTVEAADNRIIVQTPILQVATP